MIRTVLRPGQKGTRKLVKEFGEQLVCVRYRYDYQKRRRYKTVEIIIDEDQWEPPTPHPYEEERPKTKQVVYQKEDQNNDEVAVRIRWDEKDLQYKIKAIGGRWDKDRKVWFAPGYQVEQIGLGERIVRGL